MKLRHPFFLTLFFILILLAGYRGISPPTAAALPAVGAAEAAPAASATVAASPAPTARDTETPPEHGSLYFWVGRRLLSVPADCLFTPQPYPSPEPLFSASTTHIPLVWSADGSRAATFVEQSLTGPADLYLFAPLAKTWEVILTGPYGSDALAWSPDGAWLAFPSGVVDAGENGPKRNNLYVIRADGSDLQPVAPSLPGVRLSFAWVDAYTLAFDVVQPESGEGGIYLFSLTDGAYTKITPWPGTETFSDYHVSAALPGRKLAFTAWTRGDPYTPNWHTFIVSLENGNLRPAPQALPPLQFWSPNGDWVLGVIGGTPPDGNPDTLTLYAAEDFASRQVLQMETGSFQTAVWSPDSRFILVQGDEWYLLPVDGPAISVEERLGVPAADAAAPSWQPPRR